jgi:putative transposase
MSSSDLSDRRLRAVEQVLGLPACHFDALEQFLCALAARGPGGGALAAVGTAERDWPHAPLHPGGRNGPRRTPATAERDWPHAPLHRLSEHGTYVVTAGTYRKEHHFGPPDRRDGLEAALLAAAKAAGWQLEAWAVFSNHYHFVGHAGAGSPPLSEWLAELHRRSAAHVNELDGADGRQVWFNYWETKLTFEKSYLARLNYVHQNAVKHGLVPVASQYRWCSAAWFERTAPPARVRTVCRFKTDKVRVLDDFDPI